MLAASVMLALAASVVAAPQGVTSAIAPTTSAPSGCLPSYSGTFQITVANVTTPKKRDLVKRDALTLTLQSGILKDAQGRTGYIAANYQFQFDGPPQTGAIYTSGFSLCGNNSLALGGSAIFYQCLSGGFYNLYDRSWAPQCSPIYIYAMGGSTSANPTASVSQRTDGQPIATTVVSQRTDGQPIATTVVSQRTDGQVIATTGQAVTQISDGQIQQPTGVSSAMTMVHVSQKTDGQVIASPLTASPVVQKSDGQIIATPPAAPVTEKTDGQPVAPVATSTASTTGSPVAQLTDGQVIAAATSAAANKTVAASTTPKVSQFAGDAAPQAGVFTGSACLALVAAVFAALW